MLNLQSVYFGQKHPNFDYKDFDIIKKVARLAHKHLRQAVNDCNGEGFVNGQHYYAGRIDDYAKRTYGQSVKSAYLPDKETTVFSAEGDRLERKIEELLSNRNNEVYQMGEEAPFKVEFQGDPRGNTVKLYYEGDFIEL